MNSRSSRCCSGVGAPATPVNAATFAQQHLLFMVSALQQLFQDENFVNLLRAEALDTLPKYLAERVWSEGRRA